MRDRIWWGLTALIVGSMVCSLVVFVLPPPATPPAPATVRPTATLTPTAAPAATATIAMPTPTPP